MVLSQQPWAARGIDLAERIGCELRHEGLFLLLGQHL
jgi:hypothetical protein